MRNATPAIRDIVGDPRQSYVFWTLVGLLTAAFLFGGSARDDVYSLMLLRPIAAVSLAVGLFGLTLQEVARFRALMISAVVVVAIVAINLIPLPPSIWMNLPGRELAAEAARIGGSQDVWRPIALVPWRAWNAFYALMVPIAALVLAVRCSDEQRRRLPIVLLVLVFLSLLWAVVQVTSGYSASTLLYRVTNENVPTGLFANRNHFGVLIACAFPMLAVVALRSSGGGKAGALWLWLAAAAGAVGLLLLLLTGSRSGLFTAVLALASIPLVYQPARRSGAPLAWRRYLTIAAIALAAMLLVVLAVYFARAEAINRLFAVDDKDELRFEVWRPIASMIGTYFPVGSGIGSFVEIFQVAEPQELLKFSYLNHAHNDWLEYALEFGLVGIALMAAGLLGWIRSAWFLLRMRPDRDGDVLLGRVGATLILLLGLASLVDYPTRVPSIACVIVLAAVWMASGTREGRSATTRIVPWSAIGVERKIRGESDQREIDDV